MWVGERKCKKLGCSTIISNHNRTGVCRRCYRNMYRKKDQQKRLDSLRARYRRKSKEEGGDSL